jgi:hypothetical protein
VLVYKGSIRALVLIFSLLILSMTCMASVYRRLLFVHLVLFRSYFDVKLSSDRLLVVRVQDKESVMDLLKIIDKSNGYVFRGIEGNINEFNKLAAAPTKWDYDRYPFIFRVFFFTITVT